jgi:hypothetical protein
MEPLLDQTFNNKQNSFSSQGRALSKLSSRHNRRKRCGEKSRGDRKGSDRVPIPSFTPISNEYFDACGNEGVPTRLSEQSRAASGTRRKNTCSDESILNPRTKSIESDCAHDNSNQGEADHTFLLNVDESQRRDRNCSATMPSTPRICASSPKADFQETGVRQTPSENSAAEALKMKENISTGIAFTQVAASVKVSHAIKMQPSTEAKSSPSSYFSPECRIVATEETRNMNPVGMLMDDMCLDVKEAIEFPRNQRTNYKVEIQSVKLLEEKESNRKVSTFLNELSSSDSKKETSLSHVVHRNCDVNDMDVNNETIIKRSDESRLADMIEIIDDDSHIGDDDKTKPRTEYHGPSRKGSSGENIDACIKKHETDESKAKRKRKASSRVSS